MAVLDEYERAPIGTRSTPVEPTLALAERESAPVREPALAPSSTPLPKADSDRDSSAPADPHAATHASAGSGSHPNSTDGGGRFPASGTYTRGSARRALTRRRLMAAGSALAVLGIGGGILYGLSNGGGHSAGAASNVTTVSAATMSSAPPPYGSPGGRGDPGGPGAPGPGPGQTPDTPPRIWVAPADGGPHTKFVLDGANWPPQVAVTVVLSNGDSARIQPFTAPNGSLVFPLTGAAASGLLPDPLPAGAYTVTAVSGPFQVSARFTVSGQ
jgi:hypothetical protein